MAKKKDNLWVTKHPDGGWQKKKENSDRASGIFDTQKDAITSAIEQAKRKAPKLLSKGRMEKSVVKIVTEMIQTHQKTKNIN